MKSTVNRISRGLDVPISGQPEQVIMSGPEIRSVGLIADDYVGMKPTMVVQEGDRVKVGQRVFEDKKTLGIFFTSPACGKVRAVNRAAKRKFESIVIEVDGNDEETFDSYRDSHFPSLDRDKVVKNLVESGLWTSLRTRPYSKVPAPASKPKSIFVTAIDTNPLAPNPAVILNDGDNPFRFAQGLQVLSTLSDGPIYLCKAAGALIPGSDEKCVTVAEFEGPHPAGLVGTHIHLLDPVNESKTVWHIGYQDVVAIGQLFVSGKLMTQRAISLGGPTVPSPRLIRSRIGAALEDVVGNDLGLDVRVISGSVVSGRASVAPKNYLGRYHHQVSVVKEGRHRELFGWAAPGFKKFSTTRAFASGLFGSVNRFSFTTSTEGSKRAIVPIGVYEKVMPLDIVATPLLKALAVQDSETAQMLGCLELDEEDLALCTFVCPGKNEYGSLLRQSLTHIEREG